MKHVIVNYFCLPACLSVCLSGSLCLSLSLSFLSLSLYLCVCLCPSIFCSFPLTSFYLSLSLSLRESRSVIVGMIILVKNELNTIISSPFFNIALSIFGSLTPPLPSLSLPLLLPLFFSLYLFSLSYVSVSDPF